MKRPLRLETFALGTSAMPAMTFADMTAVRQAAYEAGHSDGWQAGEEANRTAEGLMRESVGAHLQALAFGYEEARDHILRAMIPLLREITAKVLPAVAERTLLPTVLEQLQPLAEKIAASPVTIRVAPSEHAAAEKFLQGTAGLPFVVRACPDLRPGQACIASGGHEREIDLHGAITAIATAVTDFFQTNWPTPAPNPDTQHD